MAEILEGCERFFVGKEGGGKGLLQLSMVVFADVQGSVGCVVNIVALSNTALPFSIL